MDHGPKEGDAAGPTAGDAARGNAAATTAASSSSGGVVVQVREKKGPLRAAIPYMPFPVAVLCLFLNTFVPGLGKPPLPFTLACPLGGARVTPPARKKNKTKLGGNRDVPKASGIPLLSETRLTAQVRRCSLARLLGGTFHLASVCAFPFWTSGELPL